MDDGPRDDDRKTWTSAVPRPGAAALDAASRIARYGDGVFVTLGIRDGVLLDAQRQLDRLRRAAAHLGLQPPTEFEDPARSPWLLAALLEELGADAASDGTARLQWHAGEGPRGFGRDALRAEAMLDLLPAPEPRRPAVVLLEGSEAPLPALPRFKTCSALAQVMCERAARSLGADAGIRTVDGRLLETSSANVLWLTEHALQTPSIELPLYAGSVRERVIECALAAGLPVEEGEFFPEDLVDVDALLLTNGARGVELARSLEGEALPGPPAVALALVDAVAARRAAGGIPLGR